jgi:hypothetical protein
MSSIVNCKFVATSWSEVPFHEMNGAGKLSRASIRNTLSGGIDAEGTLEYLLTYPSIAGDEVPFIGYERIIGRVEAGNGSFVIRHDGVFSPTSGVNGKLEIMEGSGTGDFVGITGSGIITAKAGEHGGEYALTIQYPA